MDPSLLDIDPEKIKRAIKKAVQNGYDKELQVPENAFKLGAEVGFTGHLEGVGWVKNKLESIFELADRYGLRKVAQYYYLKGKDYGRSKRSLDIDGSGKATDEVNDLKNYDLTGLHDREEFETVPQANMQDYPDLQELFRPLEEVPGVIVPRLLKMMGIFG